jgi:NAD(P)-dependent dehydrogenase (short-subunit alcohol dehydrogenase family)
MCSVLSEKSLMNNRQHPSPSVIGQLSLRNRVAVITGGAGLLGFSHACAVSELGGTPILLDLDTRKLDYQIEQLINAGHGAARGIKCDITKRSGIEGVLDMLAEKYGRVDILINNAANNPTPEDMQKFESNIYNYSLTQWNLDLEVGLTGAFLCSQVFGTYMVEHGGGVILNIGSDLGLIGPDQRIYRKEGRPERDQPMKPISYSVVKAGLVGLTRYLATCWGQKNMRVNLLAPGGVEVDQDPAFVNKLTNLIPMGRMAGPDEYKSVVAFLVSDASSYLTGAVVSVDGGRTSW